MIAHLTLNRWRALALAVLMACAFASCATYSRVSERRPRFIPLLSGPLANATAKIARATRTDRRDPPVALGEYLNAAEAALRQLELTPNDETARNTYNFAVGRIIATVQDARLDPWTQPLRVPASDGEFILTHKPDHAVHVTQTHTLFILTNDAADRAKQAQIDEKKGEFEGF